GRLYARGHPRTVGGLHPGALRARLGCNWPGDVRELENAIERAVVLCSGGPIGLDLLPETVLQPDRAELPVRLPENGSTYKDLVEDYERRLVRTPLRRTRGAQQPAAGPPPAKPPTLPAANKR